MTKIAFYLIPLVTFLCSCILAAEPSAAPTLSPGAGSFEFTKNGKTIPVWFYLPEKHDANTPILFVMHGVKRNGERYRNDWIPHAKKYGVILLAPEFSEKNFPGAEFYAYGGAFDSKGHRYPADQWTFSYLEPIFDQVRSATGTNTATYYLYGHSAGAQFVHRYLYFVPKARVAKVVAANAGWWTVPDESVKFPYGLNGSGLSQESVKLTLQAPLVVLLGTADTDPNHPELRRTPEAEAQGPYRLARGKFFYAAAQKEAQALGVPLRWTIAYAPGIAHEDKGMAKFAVEWLFGAEKEGKRK